jgi:hypothetical protein
MSPPIFELETILRQLIDEHGRLLKHVEAQQAAMKAFDLKGMDEAAKSQDACRLRVASLETKRRAAVAQIARQHRMATMPTLGQLADMLPQKRTALLKLRDELKAAVASLSARTHVAGRLAGAISGHLTTVVRLLAGAVERAGIYTKDGVPRVSNRIGVMEAVG